MTETPGKRIMSRRNNVWPRNSTTSLSRQTELPLTAGAPGCLGAEERARARASADDAPQVEASDGSSSAPMVELNRPPRGKVVERAPVTAPHVARRPLGLRICFSLGHDPRVTVVSQVPRDNSDSSSGGVCVRLPECQSCCRCGTSQIRSRATCNDPRGWTVQPSALSLLQTPGER